MRASEIKYEHKYGGELLVAIENEVVDLDQIEKKYGSRVGGIKSIQVPVASGSSLSPTSLTNNR